MRGDLKISMMPVAPAATLPSHHTSASSGKPKLGFSIESIVGLSNSKVSPSDNDGPCSDGEVAPITPPPAHVHHKLSTPGTPPYYRTEDIYSSYGPYGHQRMMSSPKIADYRNELAMTAHSAPSSLSYPSVMSPYGSPMPLGHCHGQYPLTSYLVNRDYHSYPWLMARQPRILPYRPQDVVPLDANTVIHSSPQGAAGFILHQFRKPKRIRTAFSPSQLLTLEHAFEKNHYVVGNERKQLAQNLNLTETQVKVWFQNRRTKHKRQKQEEEQQTKPSDDQSAGKSEAGSDNGRPQSYSPPIDESDESECEEDEDCESPCGYTREETL